MEEKHTQKTWVEYGKFPKNGGVYWEIHRKIRETTGNSLSMGI